MVFSLLLPVEYQFDIHYYNPFADISMNSSLEWLIIVQGMILYELRYFNWLKLDCFQATLANYSAAAYPQFVNSS